MSQRFWLWAMCRAADLADFCLRRSRVAGYERAFRKLTVEQQRVLFDNRWELYVD